MKKLSLSLFVVLFVFSSFLFLSSAVFAGNTPPVIKNFHAFFEPGYFTGVAQIYDADNDLRAFEIGALYGVKLTGEKIKIGDGCGYTCGTALQPQGNGQYGFSAMLPSSKITNEFLFIVIVGQARDAAGHITTKKVRAYPADLIPIFRRHLKQQAPNPYAPAPGKKKIF